MKSKKLLFLSLLSLSCIGMYLVFTSSATASQGVIGASATGCGGTCHGISPSSSTVIAVAGIPGVGFVNGNTYPVTLTVTNPTKLAAGFDLSVTTGTLSNPPANTALKAANTEIHHTQPQTLSGAGVATWNFSWTAPATGSTATFRVAGNAVNNSGTDAGDQWNQINFIFFTTPSAVENVTETAQLLYPNPVVGDLVFRSAEEAGSFIAVALNGQQTQLASENNGQHEYSLKTVSLAAGGYILLYKINGIMHHSRFIKK